VTTENKFLHPTLCRLEYLSPDGWVDVGRMHSLLHPEKYPERMTANRKFGRCIELGDDLKPTGRVWVSPDVPTDLSVLVPREDGSAPWGLPEPEKMCTLCDSRHGGPFDGSCLL
jgi:hypothetical protein